MRNISSGFNQSEWASLFLLGGVFFFRMLAVFIVLPVFSVYAFQLKDATPFLVGLGFGAYGFTQAIFQIPLGILSDIVGRKKIIILGIIIFALGCLLSAFADNIYTMIAGRFLQGAGAISAALIALLADQVRAELHVRAMAFIGIFVGAAFALGFLSSPFLADKIGLSGLFILLAVVSLANILVILVLKVKKSNNQLLSALPIFWQQLKSGVLNVVFLTIFTVSFGLSLFMFHLPLLLKKINIENQDFWKFYLLLLVIGILVMVPAAIIAEKYRKIKPVMITGGFFILVAALFSIILGQTTSDSLYYNLLLVLCYIFFAGFNIFEPILPSLAIKLGGDKNRGAVSGGLNFFQFMGSFFGAVSAGLFYNSLVFLPFLGLLLLCLIMLKLIFKTGEALNA